MRLCILILFGCLVCGCARQGEKLEGVVTPYDANSLRNMSLARDYMAQGRFVLAKEHYLFALASSKDPETRNFIMRELNSVDMMIKTER